MLVYSLSTGHDVLKDKTPGPVVQSIVSLNKLLTSSLRGHLVMCFTLYNQKAPIFFVEKKGEAFALQKLLTFFSTKNIGIFEILSFEILIKW